MRSQPRRSSRWTHGQLTAACASDAIGCDTAWTFLRVRNLPVEIARSGGGLDGSVRQHAIRARTRLLSYLSNGKSYFIVCLLF